MSGLSSIGEEFSELVVSNSDGLMLELYLGEGLKFYLA